MSSDYNPLALVLAQQQAQQDQLKTLMDMRAMAERRREQMAQLAMQQAAAGVTPDLSMLDPQTAQGIAKLADKSRQDDAASAAGKLLPDILQGASNAGMSGNDAGFVASMNALTPFLSRLSPEQSAAAVGAVTAARESGRSARSANREDISAREASAKRSAQFGANLNLANSIVTSAATQLAVAPTDETRAAIRSSLARIGVDPESYMAAIETEAAGARAKSSEATDRVKAYIEDGATPYTANLAANGKAYKDPITGEYAPGMPVGPDARTAGQIKGVVSLAAEVQALAEDFAKMSGANAFTGSAERLKAQIGGEQDPRFAAYEAARAQFALLLGRARSGLTITEYEYEQLKTALPELAQLQLRNGKLDASAMRRFRFVIRILQTEHAGRFEAGVEGRVRQKFMGYWQSQYDRAKADIENEGITPSLKEPESASGGAYDSMLQKYGFGGGAP